jgi:hypothetical protein
VLTHLDRNQIGIAHEVRDEAVERLLVEVARRADLAVLAFDMTIMRSETASASS